MDLPDLKDLAKLIKRCRSLGVEQIEISDSGIKLSLAPQLSATRLYTKKGTKAKHGDVHNDSERVDMPEQLSEEDLLFFSATPGLPFHVESKETKSE